MHMSAQAAIPNAWPMAEYSGTLIQPAEARVGLSPAGINVPTLCLFIELDASTRNVMQVEQPFAPEQFSQCEAAARRLKPGMRVSVQAQLASIRLVARNAAHVHVIHEPASPEAPTTNPQEPELWQA